MLVVLGCAAADTVNNPVQDGRVGPGPWSYEMGVKLQADRAVQLDAIRFWKGSLETGTHVGRLWTQGGVQLAQVTFQGETASGWQQQPLPSPVTLEANTVYVVSVGMNASFAATPQGLASQVVSGPLRSVADGQNGVHSSAAGEFPTQSYSSTNYFVDVVATLAPQGAAPSVTQVTPVDGATGVGVGSSVSATFSRAMSAATITGASFTLTPQGGSPVAATVSYDAASRTATLRPTAPLQIGTTYTARLAASITASDGVPLASAVSWSFTTSANECPCSLFSGVLQPSTVNNPVQDGRVGPGPWSYEMGVKLQADRAVQLDAIRFWKGSLETGTHVGRLWTQGGVQLAQVTFQGETASGWQQQPLPSPVTLEANTVYVVSVGMNASFAATPQGLASQVVSGPLRSVADGQNGVYGAAAGVFPNQSYSSTNYFVDVQVSVSAGSGAPGVTQTTPTGGATGVELGTTVRATFSRAMNARRSPVPAQSTPQGGSPVVATVAYDASDTDCDLDARERAGERYELHRQPRCLRECQRRCPARRPDQLELPDGGVALGDRNDARRRNDRRGS